MGASQSATQFESLAPSEADLDKKNPSIEDVKRFVRHQPLDVSLLKSLHASSIKDVDVFDAGWVGGGGTALMNYCYYRHQQPSSLEGVKFLLGCEPPANPNIVNSYGNSALFYAVSPGQGGGDDPDLVRCLLEHGADCSIKKGDGGSGVGILAICKTYNLKRSISVICDWYRSIYEKVLYRNDDIDMQLLSDMADIPANSSPFDPLLEAVFEDVQRLASVWCAVKLIDHKVSEGFVESSLGHGFDKDLIESLMLELVPNLLICNINNTTSFMMMYNEGDKSFLI